MGFWPCLHLDRWTVRLQSRGVFAVVAANESNDRNAHYLPHRHSGLTTHLILSGELTITYPEDEDSKKETFGPGARIDVGAKKLHEVWMGRVGCTYVIGE